MKDKLREVEETVEELEDQVEVDMSHTGDSILELTEKLEALETRATGGEVSAV